MNRAQQEEYTTMRSAAANATADSKNRVLQEEYQEEYTTGRSAAASATADSTATTATVLTTSNL